MSALVSCIIFLNLTIFGHQCDFCIILQNNMKIKIYKSAYSYAWYNKNKQFIDLI